jgi:hypothetical protein
LKPQAAKKSIRRGQSRARSEARSSAPAENRPGGSSETRSGERKCDWIPSLAEPYLRGYAPQFESGKSLIGYRFLAQLSLPSLPSSKKARPYASEATSGGFFVGYLLDSRGLPFLKCAPPEFLVFCFIEPVGGRAHRRLVSEPESLLRRTAEYIRWLTHHPPRFELFTDQNAALVRHIPISEWPSGRTEHYARNFTIETLAWLVRSALVRRLPGEVAPSFDSAPKSRAATK